MPKLISRGYDEDKTLAAIVRMFEGPVTAGNLEALAEMRAAMEHDLRKAVAVGDGRKISALRDALEDMSA